MAFVKDKILVWVTNYDLINGCYHIPNNVKEITNESFLSCDQLSKLIIPTGIDKIEGNAFQNCKFLEQIDVISSDSNELERIKDLLPQKLRYTIKITLLPATQNDLIKDVENATKAPPISTVAPKSRERHESPEQIKSNSQKENLSWAYRFFSFEPNMTQKNQKDHQMSQDEEHDKQSKPNTSPKT